MNQDAEPLRMSLREAAARHAYGFILPEALPRVALDALVEGYDSPHLRLLAGAPDTTVAYELHDLFGQVVSEVGLRALDPVAAARLVVWSVARYITARSPSAWDRLDVLAIDLLLDDSLASLSEEERVQRLGLERLYDLWAENDICFALPDPLAVKECERMILAECRRIASLPEPVLSE